MRPGRAEATEAEAAGTQNFSPQPPTIEPTDWTEQLLRQQITCRSMNPGKITCLGSNNRTFPNIGEFNL